MKKIISIVFMFLMVTVSSFAFFRTSVAPGIFEMNLDRSATEEIILVNNSNEPIRVKIYPGKDENIKDEEYLGEWLRIYPRTMTLEGNSERRIKFSIRAPKDKPDGLASVFLSFGTNFATFSIKSRLLRYSLYDLIYLNPYFTLLNI